MHAQILKAVEKEKRLQAFFSNDQGRNFIEWIEWLTAINRTRHPLKKIEHPNSRNLSQLTCYKSTCSCAQYIAAKKTLFSSNHFFFFSNILWLEELKLASPGKKQYHSDT